MPIDVAGEQRVEMFVADRLGRAVEGYVAQVVDYRLAESLFEKL
jgi:hypothetical protein